MTLDEFISNPPTGHNQEYVDVDKQFGGQCWDLVELYAQTVLGVPAEPWAIPLGPKGVAYEAWTDFDNNEHMKTYFDKITSYQQERGDILVYNAHASGPEGHIAIYIGDGQVFEQNANPDGSPSHSYARANTYLLGALRRKVNNIMHPTRSQIATIWLLALFSDLNDRTTVPPEVAENVFSTYESQDLQVLLSEISTSEGRAKVVAQFLAGAAASGNFKPYTGPQLFIKS